MEKIMVEIDITYDIEKIDNFFDEPKINEFVSYILKNEYKEEFDKNEYYLSLLITTNDEIQKINREYRQKDIPTDVISFAYNETENFGVVNMLGDIVISIERVKEQSSEYRHSDEREFYYVLCHGMLHLLGYDHIEEEDKVVMRRREEEILSKFNYNR
ncbi:rRNA maturation RNase YbeY [Leptotrichia sp. HSP-342]|uniref:Endoribonuclease YbeY n=2 Tax=Leptotrichia mesophila TaxID=3239303 RepID=A0AB39VCI7_9FUSO